MLAGPRSLATIGTADRDGPGAARPRREARLEAETTGEVADFLVELFEVATPERSLGETDHGT